MDGSVDGSAISSPGSERVPPRYPLRKPTPRSFVSSGPQPCCLNQSSTPSFAPLSASPILGTQLTPLSVSRGRLIGGVKMFGFIGPGSVVMLGGMGGGGGVGTCPPPLI